MTNTNKAQPNLNSNLINYEGSHILPSNSKFAKTEQQLTSSRSSRNRIKFGSRMMNSLSLTMNYPGLFPSYRLFVAIMTSVAMFLGYALLTNFSVAIVRMTYHQPSPSDAASSCDLFQNSSAGGDNLKEGDFDWSPKQQGIMLSSFYYGYAAGQVPSGIIAGKVGGKSLMGLSLIFSSIATLLTHVAATTNVALLIAVRIILGLLLSANYPAAMVLMGYWSYDNENTLLTGIATTGAKLAPVISQLVSGYLCDLSLFGGWPLVFYFWGALTLVFAPFWIFCVKEKPEEPVTDGTLADTLTRKELSYSIDLSKNIPWKIILTNMNVYACCILMACTDFMYTLLLTVVPSYLSYVLALDVHTSGFYSGLPHLLCTIFSMMCSYFTDLARQSKKMSTMNIRKLFVAFGAVVAAAFCFGIRFVACDQHWAIIFLSMGSIANACFITQICSHVLDICPNKDYVGPVFSYVNLYGICSSFMAPHVSEWITAGNPYSYVTWQKVFDMCGGINLVGAVVFIVTASSKMLPGHKHDYTVL